MDQVLFDRVHHVAPPSFYSSWQRTNRTPALETGFVLKLSPQAMEPPDRSRVWRFVLVPGWRDLSTICNCWHFEQSLVQESVFSSSLLFLNKRELCELIHLLGFPPRLKWISVFVLGVPAVHSDWRITSNHQTVWQITFLVEAIF